MNNKKNTIKNTTINDINSSFNSEDETEEEEFANNKKTNESQDSMETLCPSFTNYLYFLFAPTLVYSDNYPRYFFGIKEKLY